MTVPKKIAAKNPVAIASSLMMLYMIKFFDSDSQSHSWTSLFNSKNYESSI